MRGRIGTRTRNMSSVPSITTNHNNSVLFVAVCKYVCHKACETKVSARLRALLPALQLSPAGPTGLLVVVNK